MLIKYISMNSHLKLTHWTVVNWQSSVILKIHDSLPQNKENEFIPA